MKYSKRKLLDKQLLFFGLSVYLYIISTCFEKSESFYSTAKQDDETKSDLPCTQSHLGVGCLAELGEFSQNGHKFISQRRITATELILNTQNMG